MKHRIAFVHAAKTGGTSIDSAIRATYSPIKRFRKERTFNLRAHPSTQAALSLGTYEQQLRLELLAYYLHLPTCEYVCGHFPVTAQLLDSAWSFLTILRDPVNRWLSEYFYNRYKSHRAHAAIDVGLREFVLTDRAKRMGTTYARAYTGLSDEEIARRGIAKATELAQENLLKFTLVGFTDQLHGFAEGYRKMFGKRLSIPHKNESPVPKSRTEQELDETILSHVRALTQPDMDLYLFAREKLLPSKSLKE